MTVMRMNYLKIGIQLSLSSNVDSVEKAANTGWSQREGIRFAHS